MSRIKNWDKNYNLESAGKRQIRMKQMIKKSLKKEFALAVMLENEVKKIMGESGLPTWHNIPYLNFGRKALKIRRRFDGAMLENEIAMLVILATQNLLQEPILYKITEAVLRLPLPD
jgi:hypothetical protein